MKTLTPEEIDLIKFFGTIIIGGIITILVISKGANWIDKNIK